MSEPDDTVWLMGTPKDGDVFITRCSRCSKRLDIEMKIHPLKKTDNPEDRNWLHFLFWSGVIAFGSIIIAKFFLVGG